MTATLLVLVLLFSSCKKEVKQKSAESGGEDKTEKKFETSNPAPSEPTKPPADSTVTNNSDGLNSVKHGIIALSPEVKYSGSIKSMVKWNDKLGSNILFISETEEKWSGDVRSKQLYAYHYVNDGTGEKLLWKVNDFVNDCPVDVTLEYIDGSLVVKDINEDGVGESSFLYKLSCKGDVSSDDLKLIMHEGEKKYAIRGSTTLIMNGQTFQEGSMKIDPSFNSAPDGFREFAVSQWKKFETEKIGE